MTLKKYSIVKLILNKYFEFEFVFIYDYFYDPKFETKYITYKFRSSTPGRDFRGPS